MGKAQFFIEYNTGVDISLNGLKENHEFPFELTKEDIMEPFYQTQYNEEGFITDSFYCPQTGSGIINKLKLGYKINDIFSVFLNSEINNKHVTPNSLTNKNNFIVRNTEKTKGLVGNIDYSYSRINHIKSIDYNIISLNPCISASYNTNKFRFGLSSGLLLSFINLKIHSFYNSFSYMEMYDGYYERQFSRMLTLNNNTPIISYSFGVFAAYNINESFSITLNATYKNLYFTPLEGSYFRYDSYINDRGNITVFDDKTDIIVFEEEAQYNNSILQLKTYNFSTIGVNLGIRYTFNHSEEKLKKIAENKTKESTPSRYSNSLSNNQFFIEYSTGVDVSLNGLKEDRLFPDTFDEGDKMEPFTITTYDENSFNRDYFYFPQTGSGVINKLKFGYKFNNLISVYINSEINNKHLNLNVITSKNNFYVENREDSEGSEGNTGYEYSSYKVYRDIKYNIFYLNPGVSITYPIKNFQLGLTTGFLISFIALDIDFTEHYYSDKGYWDEPYEQKISHLLALNNTRPILSYSIGLCGAYRINDQFSITLNANFKSLKFTPLEGNYSRHDSFTNYHGSITTYDDNSQVIVFEEDAEYVTSISQLKTYNFSTIGVNLGVRYTFGK